MAIDAHCLLRAVTYGVRAVTYGVRAATRGQEKFTNRSKVGHVRSFKWQLRASGEDRREVSGYARRHGLAADATAAVTPTTGSG
ncbi:hypothetical protein [Mycobacterium colombiense]|uniref:hypothetical protein n=1 Tax=Mycobacterium colombiense TaxID=339268 RepID=UPI000B153E2E|nr:hypothetical protein [Mycobacterium colombiense]